MTIRRLGFDSGTKTGGPGVVGWVDFSYPRLGEPRDPLDEDAVNNDALLWLFKVLEESGSFIASPNFMIRPTLVGGLEETRS